jgi:hypothetical protein
MADNEETAVEEEVDYAEEHFADIISASVMVPLGDPLVPGCRYGLKSIFWGPSGIGKSEQVHQGAAKVGLQARVLVPGQRQPEDFSGVPVADANGNLKVECILGAVRELNSLGKGILFIDEASTAPPAVQGAMLTMINDGVVGDTKLEPGVRILLAANPPEMSAGGWSFEPPMANRLAHFYVKCPPVDQWIHWLMGEGDEDITPIDSVETKLKQNWNEKWSHVKGMLAGFMKSTGDEMLHDQPKSTDPKSGYAWRSPRTWYLAGKAEATIRALGMKEELRYLFVAACVGKGAATEWAEYIASADLPDPETVLTKGWKIDETRLDKVIAVNTSVISYVKGIKEKQKQYDMAALAWNYLGRVVQTGLADTAVDPGDELVRARLSRKGVPDHVKKAAEPVIFEIAKNPASKYAREDP